MSTFTVGLWLSGTHWAQVARIVTTLLGVLKAEKWEDRLRGYLQRGWGSERAGIVNP